MQIFELLSGLSIYSEEGYHLALEALADYKVICSPTEHLPNKHLIVMETVFTKYFIVPFLPNLEVSMFQK